MKRLIRRIQYSAVVLAILSVLQPIPPIYAADVQTTMFSPSADSTIVDGESTNYGGDSTLACENDGTQKSFVIKFDLSALPSDATVQGATLNLNQVNASGEDININLYRVTSNWAESSVSGTNKPMFDSGTVYGTLQVDSTLGQKTVSGNLSSIVQTWISDNSTNNGLFLESNTGGTFSHEFSSKEGGTNPQLTIQYAVQNGEGPVISDITIISITMDSATITWGTNESASSYVEYGLNEELGQKEGKNILATDHNVTLGGLSADTVYHFRILTTNESGYTSYSEILTFKTFAEEEDEEKPVKTEENVVDSIPAPDNVSVTKEVDEGGTYVLVSWDAPDLSDISGYKVFRSEGGRISYVLLAEVDADVTEYKDRSIESGSSYFYVIRTVQGDMESRDSEERSIDIFGSKLEEELNKISFWKGFVIFNLVVLPVFGVWYFVFRKKSKKVKKSKFKKRR